MTKTICDFCGRVIEQKGHKVFLENYNPECCIAKIKGYFVTDIDVCHECYYDYILDHLYRNESTK